MLDPGLSPLELAGLVPAGGLVVALVATARQSDAAPDGHTPTEHRRAATIVASQARDSLDPFALREDKRFHFAAGGVLAYRVIRRTAVVSGDPIAPPGRAPEVLDSFLGVARRHRWTVALTGASEHHLGGYRRLGLRTLQIGNEAVVDPRTFSLHGRPIRKVRQSVARVRRRGWRVELVDAADLDQPVADELERIELRWRARRRRVVGFAMTLGRLWGGDEDADGLYVLARSPDGELRAFLHFVRYHGGLSLDVMRRLGDEPNGLNEAMVVAALEHARAEGLREVSLNFAGCAHLMGHDGRCTLRRRLARRGLRLVRGRFQLERLVCFNDKFFPAWRPRYLVYPGRRRLPAAALRVLQAEGYVRPPEPRPLTAGWRPLPRPATQTMSVARSAASRGA
jgi:lysyl-tRNA synthetase, class II